ncbi:hypothetical protein LTR62_003772 [Meristemomyces frigidus]|uniref:Uncharacterized protein n=1 Tax=Meristemomyces frigidus TaxID=1508187 RepID=A0AAN7TNL9_9PEZI|nr:hypothetical protein LTR62_003772 [Meristemomyces frigidus]
MRDRRNTSLSVSSTSSSTITTTSEPLVTLQEKRCEIAPPLSPTLPSPVTKENRARSSRYTRSMVLRFLLSACLLVLVCRTLGAWFMLRRDSTPNIGSSSDDSTSGPDLPDHATALAVSDAFGTFTWTVSIPYNATFPLKSKQYTDLCEEGELLQKKLRQDSRLGPLTGIRRKPSYYTVDKTFLDVGEAEASGILPPASDIPNDVCTSSLTFLLETEDASLGKSLLMLWLSYGLAKKEGRSFFVDDTRWPYGSYASFFMPIPDQHCSLPPSHHRVPFPHQAKHLVVSTVTAPWTFGALFDREFSATGHDHHKGIYDLVRIGYEDLFHLTDSDDAYVNTRTTSLGHDAAAHGGSVVGMHIRRGDLHPLEYQYSRDYLPHSRYGDAAKTLLRELLPPRGHDSVVPNKPEDFSSLLSFINSPLLLASDDPDIISSPELSSALSPFTAQKAQERIQLATKATLDLTTPKQSLREPGSAYMKHIDENSGWEGGFYPALFYSIGSLDKSGPDAEPDSVIPEQALRMRELLGRAYLLDLAVLGQSDGVVCAVSSAGCRVLGVMLGWEKVVVGRWVNVDDRRGWGWR